MEALKDSSMDVQMAAAQGLGQLGSDASEAVDTLRDLKKELDKDLPKKKDKKKKLTPQQRKKMQLSRSIGMALRSIGGKRKK
jgi:hypothetical protein